VLADYTGKTLQEVASAYKGEIKVSSDGDYSDDIPKGAVISQEPVAGTPDSYGVLYLVISKGPRLQALPEVVGKSAKAAAEELTELGFVVTQEVEFSSDYAEGKVIRYDEYKAGDKVETDKEVVLIVSRGEEPTEHENYQQADAY
jgi:serine/threonine-protein kinase